MHCAMLLGYVQDVITNAVITHPKLSTETKNAVLRAANKVELCLRSPCRLLNHLICDDQILWIQNDLFARHYTTKPAAAPQISKTYLGTCSLIAVMVLVWGVVQSGGIGI